MKGLSDNVAQLERLDEGIEDAELRVFYQMCRLHIARLAYEALSPASPSDEAARVNDELNSITMCALPFAEKDLARLKARRAALA